MLLILGHFGVVSHFSDTEHIFIHFQYAINLPAFLHKLKEWQELPACRSGVYNFGSDNTRALTVKFFINFDFPQLFSPTNNTFSSLTSTEL